MRLHFHLRDESHLLPDPEGIEVEDVQQAKSAALEMLAELRLEDPAAARDWSGWRLEVTDAAGVVVFSVDLSGRV